MGIREKLQDFKRRLSDRKMYSIVIAIIGAISIWGLYQYKHAANLRQELDNQYNRAFYDLVGYVNNIETILSKTMLASTTASTATSLQEAWRQANLAQTNLGQLPVSQPTLAETSKFLTQLGDFAYAMNLKSIYDTTLSEEEYQNIEQLHEYSTTMGAGLGELSSQIGTGRFKWGELADKGTPLFTKTSKNLVMEQIENINKPFQSYPALIYDGPFSDHIANITPQGLGQEDVSEEQARQKLEEFLGRDKIENINLIETQDSGNMPVYSYEVKYKNMPDDHMVSIDITRKGGHPLWMINNRNIQEESLDMEQAKAFAKAFLEKNGFTDMKETYYLKEDSSATVNYAYEQEGVTIYPDLIKVKVALDNGEIVGFEEKAYLTSHRVRNIPTPAIFEEEARAKINPRVEVLGSGLAIIPTDSREEVLTYEFKGRLKDRDFLVYINAENGREQKILIIVNTPNGTLTM